MVKLQEKFDVILKIILCEIVRKIFWEQFGNILRDIWWNFVKILVKVKKKIDKILRQKSVKFWESIAEILRKIREFGEKIGEVLEENFVKFWEQFGEKHWEKLDEIFRTV